MKTAKKFAKHARLRFDNAERICAKADEFKVCMQCPLDKQAFVPKWFDFRTIPYKVVVSIRERLGRSPEPQQPSLWRKAEVPITSGELPFVDVRVKRDPKIEKISTEQKLGTYGA